MCYRYAFENKKLHAAAAKLGIKRLPHLPKDEGNFNAAPSNDLPIIFQPNSSISDGEPMMELARFGLIPHWFKGENANDLLTMNARAETLEEKPSFKHLLNQKRCLVPAIGFYEWQKVGKMRVPYFIKMKNNELFFFAGLYDSWLSKDNTLLTSFTIITTTPNKVLSDIHHRMPVILPSLELAKLWIDSSKQYPQLQHLLVPLSDANSAKVDKEANENYLIKYKVSGLINRVNAPNSTKLMEPLPDEAQSFTSSLFSS